MLKRDTRLLGMPLQASTDLSYRDLMIRIKKFERTLNMASGAGERKKWIFFMPWHAISRSNAQTSIEFKGFGATLPDGTEGRGVAENVAVTGPCAEGYVAL